MPKNGKRQPERELKVTSNENHRTTNSCETFTRVQMRKLRQGELAVPVAPKGRKQSAFVPLREGQHYL
jgi:hypothetical protein